MMFGGQERRIHRVFVTRNTEYHVRRETCVGVRDRQSGDWLTEHFAVNIPIAGSLRFFESGSMSASEGLPQVGESIYFEAEGHDMVTSAVVSVERPRLEHIAQYASTRQTLAG